MGRGKDHLHQVNGRISQDGQVRDTEPQSPTALEKEDPVLGNAMQILDHIDNLIDNGNYFPPHDYPVGPEQYESVHPRSAADIIDLLEEEHEALYPINEDEEGWHDIEAEREFHDTKVELFLNVYGLMRCFVHQDRQHARVIKKVWGVVYELCTLSAREVGSIYVR